MKRKQKKSKALISTYPISLVAPKKMSLGSVQFAEYVRSCEKELSSNAQKVRLELYSDDITEEVYERSFLMLLKHVMKNTAK